MKEDFRKYLPLVIIAGLAILSFLIVKSYIIPLISGFVLAYLARPIDKQLEKYMPKKVAALMATILMGIIIILPLILIAGNLAVQSYQSLNSEKIRLYSSTLSQLNIVKNLNLDIESLLSKLLSFLLNSAIQITRSIPEFIIGVLITIVSMYFLILQWDAITARLQKYLPVDNKRKLSQELAKTTSALIYGTVLIAIIEFCIAALGFWLAGIDYIWLLAVVIALSAFIPGIGPGAIWIPLAIIYLFNQNYFAATIIIITGLIISIGIDFVLRTKITSKSANIHPLLVLIGILGGVSLFGIFGFIIGPLIVGYTVKIIEEIIE